jgi:hypothetical protein
VTGEHVGLSTDASTVPSVVRLRGRTGNSLLTAADGIQVEESCKGECKCESLIITNVDARVTMAMVGWIDGDENLIFLTIVGEVGLDH